jgi:multiple sugar transport system substrate-binding protein
MRHHARSRPAADIFDHSNPVLAEEHAPAAGPDVGTLEDKGNLMNRSVRLVAIGAAATVALGAGSIASAQDKQVITMIAAQYTDNMQPYFDELSASFEEANPQYDVQVEVVSWNDIDQKIKTLVQTGQMPDIANLNYFASFAADGLLYTAEEIVSPEVLADIIPAFMDNSKYEGVAYAVPDLASDRLFFSNPDLLAAAGVEKVPATWSELLAACQQIKATTPDIIPLAMPLGPEEAQAEFFIWAGGNGGGYFKDGEWVVNSPENVETLTFLKQLVDEGCTQQSPATTNRTDGAWPLFYQGKAAMTNGAIFLPSVMEEKGASVPYTVSPFIANDGKQSVTLGVQDYFFGFKKDGNQAGIQAFLTHLFQPDNYAAFLEAAGGFLPATLSAAPIVAEDPAMKPFVDVLPTAVFYPGDQANWPAVQGQVQQTIGTGVQGADPQQVLDAIQAVATGG